MQKGSLCGVTSVTINNRSFVEPGTGHIQHTHTESMFVHEPHPLTVLIHQTSLSLCL